MKLTLASTVLLGLSLGKFTQQVRAAVSDDLNEFVEVASYSCEAHGFSTITNEDDCIEAATSLGRTITWGPHGGYEDVVDGCSARFSKSNTHLFFNSDGVCDPTHAVDHWTYTECSCTEDHPCLCSAPASKFVIQNDKRTWLGHENHRANKCGGHLASVTDAEENEEIAELVDAHSSELVGQSFWLGGQYMDVDGSASWYWPDESGLDYTSWSTSYDSSQDEISDATFAQCAGGTCTWNAKHRNSAKYPAIYRLPYNYMDKSIYPDCDTSYFLTTEAYSLIDQKKSASDARDYCLSYGSDLASISSAEENTEVANLCGSAANGVLCWIGLSDAAQEGSPEWLDGSALVYQNWNPDEVHNGDNQGDGRDNVVISGVEYWWFVQGAWKYNDGDVERVFVCNGDVPDVL